MSELDAKTLGIRIREARERAGLSQGKLAEESSLERTAVNKIETGMRKVSALELSDIASALGARMASFLEEPVPALVAHRMTLDRGTDESKIDQLIEAAVNDVEFLDSLTPQTFALAAATAGLEAASLNAPVSASDAEALALQARKLIGLNDREPALGLVSLVERVGLLAFASDLGADSADAATVLLRVGGVSLVNSHNKLGRRRLALAHELGHYLGQDQYTVDWRVATDESSANLEALLDRFARSVLLPEIGLRHAWARNEHRELRDLAVILGSEFRVDMSTLARRSRELGLIDRSEADQIRSVTTTRADFVEFGLHMEPEMEGTSLPLSYQRAVLSLVRDERISRERALELLRNTFAESDLPAVRARREDELWNFVS